MLLYKVLILFWRCTRTCSHAPWFENRIIFSHNLHYYNTFLPCLTQTARLVPSLMKAKPSEKRNVLWLVSCPSALWLAKSLDGVTAPPLTKTATSSILPYKFRPRAYRTRGTCTDTARHIKVVLLLLLLFLAKSHFRSDVNNSYKITALTMDR